MGKLDLHHTENNVPITEAEMEVIDEEFSQGKLEDWKVVDGTYYGNRNFYDDSVVISVQVPRKLREALKAEAKRQNCNQSDLIRAYISIGLAK